MLVTFVAIAATIYFGFDLGSEPRFTDESAYIFHSYYYRLWSQGNFKHPDWLHLAAYDSPPLFKYLIGYSLMLHGFPVPTSIVPAEQWYQSGQQVAEEPSLLRAARLPMMLGAVVGVIALCLWALALDGSVAGVLAATFLATSPLYFTHARRAMGDDLALGLMMFSFVLYIAAANRLERSHTWTGIVCSLAAGLCLGLAAATKLSALIGPMVICAVGFVWAIQTACQKSFRTAAQQLFVLGGGLGVSAAIFVAINPYFYAKVDLPEPQGQIVVVAGIPRSQQWLAQTRRLNEMNVWQRLQFMLDYRLQAMTEAMELFPNDVLEDPRSRCLAIIHQGMGRWMPGGKEPITRRLNAEARDLRRAGITTSLPLGYWCVLPLTLSLAGCWVLAKQVVTQWRRQECMVAIVPIVWMLLDVTILTRNLTLNWDRYYMSVVAWCSLLSAVGLVYLVPRLRSIAIRPAEPTAN